MADKREQILTRILLICTAVPGIVHAQRNEIGLKREQQPGIVLLDGDETVYRTLRTPNQFLPPQIMRMKFGLFLQVKDKKPVNEGVGTLLNSLRLATIKKLATDTVLKALVGPNGAIEFTGIVTDLKVGAAISGEMMLEFTCNYIFDHNA